MALLRSLRDTTIKLLLQQPAAAAGLSEMAQSRARLFSGLQALPSPVGPLTEAATPPWARTLHQQLSLRHFRGTPCSGGASRPAAPGQAGRRLQASTAERASQQGRYLIAIVVGMVGMTYAAVPLYRMFCQATGFGGTVKEGRGVEAKLAARGEARDEALEAAAAARELTVTFNADVSDGLPWRFVPTQRSVRVRPGQSTLAFYTAHNRSGRALTGVSTYNVTPQQAGQYFNKIQCFCFEEQKLRAGEKVDMPVFFYIDPEFATDPRMKGINHITLSYTFFKVAEEEEEEGGEEGGAAAGAKAQGAALQVGAGHGALEGAAAAAAAAAAD